LPAVGPVEGAIETTVGVPTVGVQQEYADPTSVRSSILTPVEETLESDAIRHFNFTLWPLAPAGMSIDDVMYPLEVPLHARRPAGLVAEVTHAVSPPVAAVVQAAGNAGTVTASSFSEKIVGKVPRVKV